MQLYLTSLATAVGRNQKHSLAYVVVRLLALCLLALICSLGLSSGNSLPEIHVIDSNYRLLLCSAVFVQFVVIALLVGRATLTRSNTFCSQLLILPLTTRTRTIAWLIPDITICILGLLVMSLPAVKLLHSFGFSHLAIYLCAFVGSLSSFGVVYGVAPRKSQTVANLAIVGTELFLTRVLFSEHYTIAALSLLVIIFLYLTLRTLHIPQNLAYFTQRNSTRSPTRPLPLPASFWMLRKIIRNRRTLVSVGVTTAYSIIILALCMHQHASPATFLPITAILAAACITDMRGIARKYNPPEICALKGTASFLLNIGWGFALCSLALLPLLVATQLAARDTTMPSYIFLGLSSGLLASCVFVSQNRDVSGQFATMLLTIGLFMGFPQMSIAQDWTVQRVIGMQIILSTLFITITYFIEYRRNTYSWR